ncbi:hypothetical protein EVU45_24795, partial [Salmonella enterica subsp. enterica serovar Enteritidis]|nr:hypothetical protein [Salmonella enterica subsp. enterica serovar Enteritidis]
DVKDESGAKIGKLETSLVAQAYSSTRNSSTGKGRKHWVYAENARYGFYGGLGRSAETILTQDISEYMPGILDHWIDQGASYVSPDNVDFSSPVGYTHNSYYLSAIKPNQVIKITLDKAVDGETPIKWKASLPVTVVYM